MTSEKCRRASVLAMRNMYNTYVGSTCPSWQVRDGCLARLGEGRASVAGGGRCLPPSALLRCAAVKPGLFAKARDAEQRGNREGRDLWDRYATHRERATGAALGLAPASLSGGRLCWLGAGNANDIDL